MAKKGSFSKVYDKNGDYADVEAVRFDGTRTFQMQGDVTASQTWNGDPSSPLTLNASIGAKKVTQDKIGDKAVGSGQMADGSVGLTQMDPNAMTSSATSGDTRLITAGGVRTEIDNAILNRGKDYGPMTPTQINAISETIPTGSTVHVTAAGTITDGDIEVRQGEDLKYYRSGNTHYWYSMDGDFKLKQQAKTSPTASGNTLEFIDSITQDENGEISATKKTVQDGTTSQKGVVQLEDSYSSTSTTKAATPNSVKSAYDLANTANTGLANKLDKTGDGKDVTATFTEASARENIGTGEKLSVIFGKIKKWFTDLKALAFKDTVSDSDISGTISDNHIASASTWNGKADANNSVTIYDASVARVNTSGNSWYKIAEVPLKDALQFRNAEWDVFANVNDDPGVYKGRLILKSQSTSSAVAYANATLYADAWNSDVFNFKTVVKTTLNDGYVQIWAKVANNISSLSISERFLFGVTYKPRYKGLFTYTSYDSVAGSAEPQTDAQNNIVANPATLIYRQHAIASPTADNLVAMDANGLVKDSGIGSGTLSTALTKLNGIAAGAEANVQADWDEADTSSDAFIKNKPLYNLYSSSASYKVIASVADTTTSSGVSWSLMYSTRFQNASAFGVVQGHGDIRCSYIKTAGNATSTINFYKAPDPNTEGRTLIIAYLPSYTRFQTTSFVRKVEVDFSVFGNKPPEGTTYTDSNLVKAETIAQSEGSSGTAPVKVDESGELTPVPMDSTPTPSSTNLMTSGDIKTALDAVSANVYPWYRTGNGNGSETLYRVCDIGVFGTNNWSGYRFVFDYIMEYNSDYAASTGSVEVKIRTVGTTEPDYYIAVRPNAGKHSTALTPTFKLYKKWTNNGLSMILCVVVGGPQYNGIRMRVNGCTNQGGLDYSHIVTMSNNTVYSEQAGYTEVTFTNNNYFVYKNVYYKRASVGSASIPTYVNINGEVVPCTDTFVNNIEYVANQSGGGGNLNKTINGTTTSVLTFMNDSEAVAIWNDAKTAAANAS